MVDKLVFSASKASISEPLSGALQLFVITESVLCLTNEKLSFYERH